MHNFPFDYFPLFSSRLVLVVIIYVDENCLNDRVFCSWLKLNCKFIELSLGEFFSQAKITPISCEQIIATLVNGTGIFMR